MKKTALNKKIKRLWPKQCDLQKLLGYASAGSISGKMSGNIPWTATDAIRMAEAKPGQITTAEICPSFFKK